MMASYLTQVLALLMVANAALALRCYKCDSSQSSTCAYGLASFLHDVVDCDQTGSALTSWLPKACVKIVAKDKKGAEYVARDCMPATGGACGLVAKTLQVFSNIDSDADQIQCLECDKDKCNSATRYGLYTTMGVVMAALAFLL